MPIRFACPNSKCGKTIVVKDEFAGRTGKCPGCANPVKIPAAMPAFEVVEDDEIIPPAAPKKKPVIVVEEEDAPRPKKKPVIVVEDEAPAPKAKKPVVVADDEDVPPPPRKKPTIVVEDAEVVPPAPPPKKKPAVVVEDAEVVPPPRPAKKAAVTHDDENEPAPPKKGKVPALRKAAVPASLDDDVLGRSSWYVREDKGLFSGNTRAGLFESPESTVAYAVVRDATWKLFGFVNVEAVGWKPRFKFQLRRDNKDGPVLLTIERFIPKFDIPFKTPKPVRWEVRGPDDGVVGSVTLSRAGFSVIKLITKGQFFQEEHFVLDAAGQQVGTINVERNRMGAPTYMGILDPDGVEYGTFSSQFGKVMKEDMDEVKKTGKAKVRFTVTVGGKGDEKERGIYGKVNPDRVGDPYSRVMTLAVAILLENLGYEAFMGAKSRKT